ncbi:MAG: DUF1259 domain-containing protein [Planctomycetes bacterium]|nr:DUF1259 domain-containing protein [Planctomycetota bacterium]
MSSYHRFCFIVLLAALALPATAADPSPIDTAKIDEVTGLKGTMNQEEGVYKVSSPRADVTVTVDGGVLPPFMGLTSWAAFMADPKGGAMVMGDLVLLEDEVNPVMSALFENGMTVTALHNHFFFSQPQVSFMHIGGQDTADKLATGVRAALDQVKAIRSKSPDVAKSFQHPALPATSSVTAEPLTAILGGKPATKDGMVKYTIGRSVTMPCGCSVGKEMGINTWAAFMGSDETSVVAGDVVMVAGELQPVLRALRASGINVVAIHNHMVDESPKLIYLHYWGVGKALDLATSLKTALDAQAAVTKADEKADDK